MVTALAISKCISYTDAIKIALLRGQLSKKVEQEYGGAMMAVLGSENAVNEIIASNKITVATACINSPNQLVITGKYDQLDLFRKFAKKRKVICKLLKMEGQYHCNKFDMVKSTYADFIHSLSYDVPSHTIISTINGQIIKTGTQIKEELINQLTTQVNFVKCILKASQTCGIYIELGNNDVFTDILQDIYTYFQL